MIKSSNTPHLAPPTTRRVGEMTSLQKIWLKTHFICNCSFVHCALCAVHCVVYTHSYNLHLLVRQSFNGDWRLVYLTTVLHWCLSVSPKCYYSFSSTIFFRSVLLCYTAAPPINIEGLHVVHCCTVEVSKVIPIWVWISGNTVSESNSRVQLQGSIKNTISCFLLENL